MTFKHMIRLGAAAATIILLSACSLISRAGDSNHRSRQETQASNSSSKSDRKSADRSDSSSSSSQSSSKQAAGSPTDQEPETAVDGLPQHADQAAKDKIYATGNSKVFYQSDGAGSFQSQISEFSGYTEDRVKEILGNPNSVITDSSYIKEQFQNQELTAIRPLFQAGKITEEQAKAFYASAVDIALAAGLSGDGKYTLYSYTDKQLQLIFSQGELLYMTPNPDYLSFK